MSESAKQRLITEIIRIRNKSDKESMDSQLRSLVEEIKQGEYDD